MRPRANTLGIIFRGTDILLEQQNRKHSVGTGIYYRPIGGTIELGERSEETLIREFKEEIDAEIQIKQYIACLENIFKIDEQIGHEITQLYVAAFCDQELYQKELFKVTELGKESIAKWVPLEELWEESFILFPLGLKEEIRKLIHQ